MAKKSRGKGDPWRTRRVLGMYAAGEAVPEIALLVGWSEGRVRKALCQAGFIVTEEDRDGGPREE